MRIDRRSRHRSPEDVLPMTGMIDVVFLLLVFFLLTASFVREQSLSAQLSSGASAATSVLEPQVVRIVNAGDGTFFQLGARRLSTRSELEAMLSALPREAGVFVRAESDVHVEYVASALQAAHDAGYLRIGYVPAQ